MSSILPGLLVNFMSTPEADFFNDIFLVDKDGYEHSVSKIIMAAHSDVLFKIFTQENEQSKTIFNLPTVSGLSLVKILDWIECGELDLSWTSVVDVLETAEFLDISSVSSRCQKWLEKALVPDNVLGIWRFAKDHFLPNLERSSWKFLTERFVEIFKTEEFLELSSDILRIILISDELSCGEEEIWEGLLVWLGNKQQMEEVTNMMETVRFGLLEPDFYLRRVISHSLFLSLAPKVETVLSKSRKSKSSHYWTRPRCPQSLLFVFGGWSGDGPISTISVYDPAAAMWRDLTTTLPDNWAYMATVVVGTDVYLCGGHMEGEGNWATNVLMKFCPNTMKISRLAMMREKRNFLSLSFHSGSIYAFGGNKEHNMLNSVERYDISLNQWFKVKSMSRSRSDAGAATLRGKIYVVGGWNLMEPATSSVEVFCPRMERWSNIRSMREARSGAKVVAMGGLLYVVGGCDGHRILRSGEVYNPDTQMWSDLPNMDTPRSNHSMAVVQGKLIVMGGYQGWETTRKVEELDVTSKTWEDVGELSTSRSALSCGVVTFNRLHEKVRENYRWIEDVEEMAVDGMSNVLHGTEHLSDDDWYMYYGGDTEESSDDSSLDYADSGDDSDAFNVLN